MIERLVCILVLLAGSVRADVRLGVDDVEIFAGYRSDRLSFALPFSSPLPGGSELIWDDLGSLYTQVDFTVARSSDWRTSLTAGYGGFYSGRVSDRDWLNSFGTFSYTEHDADEGGVTNLGVDFAKRAGSNFEIALGYRFQRLDLHVLEKGSVDITPGGRTFRGLDTTYDAQTHMIRLGIATTRPVRRGAVVFNSDAGIGSGYYRAVADWNLRSDFAHPKSFVQQGVPLSFDLGVEGVYGVSGSSSVGVRLESGGYTVLGARERLYLSSGEIYEGELDEITASSAALGIFYRKQF